MSVAHDENRTSHLTLNHCKYRSASSETRISNMLVRPFAYPTNSRITSPRGKIGIGRPLKS
jgi:hypothetical protein